LRYLTSIPLALIMLIALACTTTPAEPTPNIDATLEARAKELVAEQVNNLRPNPDLAIDYFNRGAGYALAGDWQLTIGDFTKAIELGLLFTISGYPDEDNVLGRAYNDRGVAHGRLGQYQNAIFDYTKAIQLDPGYAHAYYNRGITYYELGQYERANADESTACSFDSKYC